MTSRERIQAIIAGEPADRCGFWLGDPKPETMAALCAHLGVADGEAARVALQDDFRWVCPQWFPDIYRHPDGRGMFDNSVNKTFHGAAGPFAEIDDPAAVEDFDWPNPDYLYLDDFLDYLPTVGPYYRASGFWTCFYHNVMDLFGMDQYMMNMHLAPEIVLAVTDKVCGFYYEANRRLFERAGDRFEGFFFGNDFGTQLDLICGPTQFDAFILPWFRKFTALAHDYGYQVILHSCGAIHRVIERLIDARVDCLHPLQALARDMDADTLARDFRGRIAFLGGVDTQDLLVHGTPDDIRAEVHRLKATLGPRLIVSPSHEAVLPNVSAENLVAMAEAAVA